MILLEHSSESFTFVNGWIRNAREAHVASHLFELFTLFFPQISQITPIV